MPDIPDDFLEEWQEGRFPGAEARDWLRENEDSAEGERVSDFMRQGLSMEWAMAATDAGMPDISIWDHVTLSRDFDGSYDVLITAGGETFAIEAANDDTIAVDQVWGDFWYDVILEYDIPTDKEIDSPGGSE